MRLIRALAVASAIVILTTALARCRLLEPEPPFQYLSAVLVGGAEAHCHRLLGMHYALRNTGSGVISSVHVSFRLYDESGGQMPSPGDNYFDLTYSGAIGPASECEICTSLDSSFFFLPSGGLVVDGFRIYRIDFQDGGRWSDPFDLYRYPYPVAFQGSASPEALS